MKLFELHSESGDVEGTLNFDLIPSDDLACNLSEKWMEKLSDEVSDVFIEVMNKSQDKEPDNNIRFLKIVSNFDQMGIMGLEFTAGDCLTQLIESLDEPKRQLFEELTTTYNERIMQMLHEYANVVANLSAS
jgi:hypothetical protein